MILIAHRGLVNGPNKELENKPEQITKALSDGYDCEVDVWRIYDKWFLGHDHPDYQVTYEFLNQPNLWLHAKNLDALKLLIDDEDVNCFWHQEDDFTLTSWGYIWTYPGKVLTPRSIMVMPEWKDPELKNLRFDCFGICSDYVTKIKGLMPTSKVSN